MSSTEQLSPHVPTDAAWNQVGRTACCWWDQTTDVSTTPMGDEDFAGFYKAAYQRLLGQLFAVTGDLAEAENVLQEAYATRSPAGPRYAPTTSRRRGCGGWP